MAFKYVILLYPTRVVINSYTDIERTNVTEIQSIFIIFNNYYYYYCKKNIQLQVCVFSHLNIV